MQRGSYILYRVKNIFLNVEISTDAVLTEEEHVFFLSLILKRKY